MRQRGSGSWELRAYLGTDPETGKRRYATRTVRGTKRAAPRALVELVDDASHAPRAGARSTVEGLLREWVERSAPNWSRDNCASGREYRASPPRPIARGGRGRGAAADYRKIAAGCAGDIDEVDRCLAIAGYMARQLDQPTLVWAHVLTSATRELIAGNIDAAEQLATKAEQVGTDGGEPDAVTMYDAQLMHLSWQRGTMGDYVAMVEHAADENPGTPASNAPLAVAYAELGRVEDARRLLEALVAVDFDLPVDPDWLTGMAMYAHAAIECRDPQYAEPLFDRLVPWAEQLVYSATRFPAR